jgi:D-alanine-D-alanine ligase
MQNKELPHIEPKKIVFLFGGPGDEHEVSVATAKSAIPSFEDQFVVLPVFINKDNQWNVSKEYCEPKDAWIIAESLMEDRGINQEVALDEIEKSDPYVVFIGLHGRFGEDGTIQTLLEARGLAYTGSDAEASALAIDKPKVLQILQDEDILTPEFLEVHSATPESNIRDFTSYHGFPVVILPADSGSSVGVTIVKNENDIMPAIEKARTSSGSVMLSQYIKGREVSTGVLVTGSNELVCLPPTELIPTEGHDFFDYEAKYLPNATKELTPAPMDEAVINQIQALAKQIHHLVSADGYSRTDMIVGDNNAIYVLEINTLPGLTATSILPQQAQVYGLSFGELLTVICNNVDRTSPEYMTALSSEIGLE